MTATAPWPVVVTVEPVSSTLWLQHPEPVITIPCSGTDDLAQEPVVLTWLDLLGQR
ncbi:MAG: hypothetical protein RLZZ515_1041 [Cyanobacteriota bacterium]|jgi:hypothetical protein